jgi:hypothetical protein
VDSETLRGGPRLGHGIASGAPYAAVARDGSGGGAPIAMM